VAAKPIDLSLKTFAGFWTNFQPILIIAQFLLAWGLTAVKGAMESSTTPVAGYTFQHVIPPNGSDPSDKGRRLVEYIVYNPGPADIIGCTLSIGVDEEYDEAKSQLVSNLKLTRRNSSWTMMDNGNGAVIDVVLLKENGQTQTSPLGCGCEFGVLIDVPDKDWRPRSVHLNRPGKQSVEASGELSRGTAPEYWFDVMYSAAFWILIGSGIWAICSNVFWYYWKVPHMVKTEYERQLVNREQDGYVKNQGDVLAKNQVKDGASDSDKFEGAMKEEQSKHPTEPAKRAPG
jgi:hypothetical protein